MHQYIKITHKKKIESTTEYNEAESSVQHALVSETIPFNATPTLISPDTHTPDIDSMFMPPCHTNRCVSMCYIITQDII